MFPIARADVASQPSRWGGFVGVDNAGIQQTGHMIYSLNGYLNDIIGNDQWKMGGSFTSKTNKGQFFFATYQIGVGSHGTLLRTNFTYSKSLLGDISSTYAYGGHGKSFLLEALQPIYITPSSFLQIVSGYGLLRGKTSAVNYSGVSYEIPNENIGLFAENATIKETIPTLYAYLDFKHLYSMGEVWGNIGATVSGHFFARTQYKVVGGLVEEDFDGNRIYQSQSPKQNTQKINFVFNDLVVLPDHFGLLLASRGQFAFVAPLPLGLKFGFYDGAFLGQGFLADTGVAGRTELQWNWNIYKNYFKSIQFFSAYAVGFLRNDHPLLVNYTKATPMTFVTGLRSWFLKKANGFVELAKPLRRKTAIDNQSGWRFFFGLGVDF